MEDTFILSYPQDLRLREIQFPIVATIPAPHDFYQTLSSLDILAYSS